MLLTFTASARAQGSATNVAVSPRTIVAGGTVSVTATGTNPCGAVRINYGDGDAITYAITQLPTTQSHVYKAAGTYTITAEGMGNCAGAPTTSIAVTAPPPPPPSSTPTIKDVEISPKPGRVGQPVTVIARGSGACRYDVEYGDGTSERVETRFPEDSHHTYARPGRYVVIVRPVAPCAGKFTQVLDVEDRSRQLPARITKVVAPANVAAGDAVAIAVEGEGTCAYDIYYGDGAEDQVAGPLPQRTEHVYARPGRYAVVVKPQPPCTGKFSEVVRVGRGQTSRGPHISEVIVQPDPASTRQPVRLTIEGSGACALSIDYGDGNSDSRSLTLPASLRHVYSAPGRYTVVVASDDARCTGSARASFDVRRYVR